MAHSIAAFIDNYLFVGIGFLNSRESGTIQIVEENEKITKFFDKNPGYKEILGEYHTEFKLSKNGDQFKPYSTGKK